MSKQRALIKTLVTRALKGNDRATAKVLDLYLRILGIEDEDETAEAPLSQEERDVLMVLEARIQRKLSQSTGSGEGGSS